MSQANLVEGMLRAMMERLAEGKPMPDLGLDDFLRQLRLVREVLEELEAIRQVVKK